MLCRNCRKEVQTDAKFCDNCGNELNECVFCDTCGYANESSATFCKDCGQTLKDDMSEKRKDKMSIPKISLKISKKFIAILGTCVSLILIAAIVLSLISSNKSNVSYALYVKDKEMFYTDASKNKTWQVTDKFIEDDELKNKEIEESRYEIGELAYLAMDGKTLFYADKVSEEGLTLYCRNVNKPKNEPIKIDTDIVTYSVNENADIITYIKGEEDRVLYQSNLKDKEKIASNVNSYWPSPDGKRVVYTIINEGNYSICDIYVKQYGKEIDKIASDADAEYISEDGKKVYFIKEDILYKKEDVKEKEKIASDVSAVVRTYETGEMYYIKSNKGEYPVLDFIEDDLKESDLSLTKPSSPQYPSYWDYDTSAEYRAAVDRYDASYETYKNALKIYEEKEERDYLRESLKDDTIDLYTYTLCYYDGKEEKVIADNVLNKYSALHNLYNTSLDKAVICFLVLNFEGKKQKLSELVEMEDDDIERAVITAAESGKDNYISIKGNAVNIERPKARHFMVSIDGSVVYFMDENSEGYAEELYRIKITNNQINSAELYDTEVFMSSLDYLDDNTVIYVKDGKHKGGHLVGDLYINKELIDNDVAYYKKGFFSNLKDLVYLTDIDEEKETGTLKVFKNGKSQEVAEDVFDFCVTPGDEVLYLNNYSKTSYRGDLFVYDGKHKKTDEDVVCIIPYIQNPIRGDI